VRDFLLHGPVEISGKQWTHLVAYYYSVTKGLMRGHSCNVTSLEVASAVSGPVLICNWCMMQQLHCFVVDAVTWGLCDFAEKTVAPSRQV
jgi:hypothetical protein